MKILLDFLPIVLFFLTFNQAEKRPDEAAALATDWFGFMVSGGAVGAKEAPVLLATVVVVVATMLQILVLKVLRKPVDKMLWAGLVVVVVLGGLTLWFHDETFIKWKPTVIYWLMATGFLITEIVLGKKMLRQMMGGQVHVPDPVWRKLGWAWVLFFAGMGVLNLWVPYTFPTDTWVSFKMWGSLGLTLVFTLAQGVYLSRHMAPDEAPAEASKG